MIQCHLKSQVQQVNKHSLWSYPSTRGSCGCHRPAPVWILQYTQTATLSDGNSEQFLSFNYSFLLLSNTSHHILLMHTTHTIMRKTKRGKNSNSIPLLFGLIIQTNRLAKTQRLGQFSLYALADSHLKYVEANESLKQSWREWAADCFISSMQLIPIKIWVVFPQ